MKYKKEFNEIILFKDYLKFVTIGIALDHKQNLYTKLLTTVQVFGIHNFERIIISGKPTLIKTSSKFHCSETDSS